MKLSFNKETLDFKVEIESDQDVIDADRIGRLMAHEDWKILAMAFAMIHKSILEGIKHVTASEAQARMAQIKAAVLKGYDNATDLPELIVSKATIFKAKRQAALLLEEEEHGNERDGQSGSDEPE